MSILDKWAKSVSKKEEAEVNKAMEEQKSSRSYKEVPKGSYEVVVDKLEIGQASWGDDQINIWFKIIDGEYANSRLFYSGSFDDHFEHGINSTAILLSQLLNDALTPAKIAVILGHFDDDMGRIEEFLEDCAEEVDTCTFDIDYDIQHNKSKTTGKTYTNHFYTVTGVYEK